DDHRHHRRDMQRLTEHERRVRGDQREHGLKGRVSVVFQTYPSLAALYDAYTAQVNSLNSGRFRANFQDCGPQQTYGEVSWNHQFQHPKTTLSRSRAREADG